METETGIGTETEGPALPFTSLNKFAIGLQQTHWLAPELLHDAARREPRGVYGPE